MSVIMIILIKVTDIVPVSVLMLWLVLRIEYQWILIIIIRVHYFTWFVYWFTVYYWSVQIIVIIIIVIVVINKRFVYCRG